MVVYEKTLSEPFNIVANDRIVWCFFSMLESQYLGNSWHTSSLVQISLLYELIHCSKNWVIAGSVSELLNPVLVKGYIVSHTSSLISSELFAGHLDTILASRISLPVWNLMVKSYHCNCKSVLWSHNGTLARSLICITSNGLWSDSTVKLTLGVKLLTSKYNDQKLSL